MEKHIINTDSKNYDSDGSAMIYFQADTIQLANGDMHTRFIKIDCRKEYNQGFTYDSRKKWGKRNQARSKAIRRV
jgi:hypothetical protein